VRMTTHLHIANIITPIIRFIINFSLNFVKKIFYHSVSCMIVS